MIKNGKIYFLRRADGLIKIGYTTNLDLRIHQLSKSHGPLEVVRVINGDRRREQRLHGALSKFNEFGEWFRDCPEVRQNINAQVDGTIIEIAKTEAEKNWLAGEAKMIEEARDLIKRLVQNRRQWLGCTNEEAFSTFARDYGIGEWVLKNIYFGRSATVSAYTMRVLETALPKDFRAHHDHLLALVEVVRADRASA